MSTFSRVATDGPRGSLLTGVSRGNNHGGANGVAIHRRNNNRGHRCHVVSFGHAGSGVPTGMTAVRCSPGHSSHVTLLGCTSNRGHCVLTPGNLGINSIMFSNPRSSVGPNGYLPLTGVPSNARVRGVRLGVNGNNRVIHSTNASTRLVNGSGNCTVLHLPSNRVHHIHRRYHTAVNIINGTSRDGLMVNGTNHRH